MHFWIIYLIFIYYNNLNSYSEDICVFYFAGDINVEVANCKGEYITRLPGSQQRKLLVELKIIWHCKAYEEKSVSIWFCELRPS